MDGGSDRRSKARVHGVAALFTNKVHHRKKGRGLREVFVQQHKNNNAMMRERGGVRAVHSQSPNWKELFLYAQSTMTDDLRAKGRGLIRVHS